MLSAAIKQAALDAMEANGPVAVMIGTVTNENPLEVNVDQRFTLDADFLVIPESLVKYEIDTLLIRRGLEIGDRLILLRMQGGQQYVALDRVASL